MIMIIISRVWFYHSKRNEINSAESRERKCLYEKRSVLTLDFQVSCTSLVMFKGYSVKLKNFFDHPGAVARCLTIQVMIVGSILTREEDTIFISPLLQKSCVKFSHITHKVLINQPKWGTDILTLGFFCLSCYAGKCAVVVLVRAQSCL